MKNSNFVKIMIPSLTVFLSSACIMIIELVASRLIARHLGSSMYTWTTVIGVILGGITIGNYIGGRIADRYKPKRAISILFLLSSISCIIIIVLNNVVGEWIWLWKLNLSLRILTHISLIFLLPSVLLGTISPVVAKFALDQGLPQGRTVGDIYACGAAGSIAGTFLAGFYLIASMGTVSIIWTIAFVLLLMSLFYRLKNWAAFSWAAILIILVFFGNASQADAMTIGANLGLREEHNPDVLYEDESNYCYVKVEKISENPDTFSFVQDRFVHSLKIEDNVENFQHFYMNMYAAVTNYFSNENDTITTLTIGGGGYVFPRYLDQKWPGSRIDVVEIDPGVTKAATEAYGLPSDTTINTFNMDARNYIDLLLYRKNRGENIPLYDFIYEDAINHYSVPYQLVTKEFNEKIIQLMNDDGIYMLNLLDIYDHGKLLGSIVETLKQTFDYVYVTSKPAPNNRRNTYIVISSMNPIDMQAVLAQWEKGGEIWLLNNDEMSSLEHKSKQLVLTDDYVPVDHMLTPMIQQSAMEFLCARYRDEAKEFTKQGYLDKAIGKYRQFIDTDETKAVLGFNQIAVLLLQQGKKQEAIETLNKAIEVNENAKYKINIPSIHLNLALLYRDLNETEQSNIHFNEAVIGFKNELRKNTKSLTTLGRLSNTLQEMKKYDEAISYYEQILNLNPHDVNNHRTLAQCHLLKKDYDSALSVLEKAKGFMTYLNRGSDAEKLQKDIEFVTLNKLKKSE